jgi:hypothetical protein
VDLDAQQKVTLAWKEFHADFKAGVDKVCRAKEGDRRIGGADAGFAKPGRALHVDPRLTLR